MSVDRDFKAFVTSAIFNILSRTPTAITFFGIFFVTILLASMIEFSSMLTAGVIVLLNPNQTLF